MIKSNVYCRMMIIPIRIAPWLCSLDTLVDKNRETVHRQTVGFLSRLFVRSFVRCCIPGCRRDLKLTAATARDGAGPGWRSGTILVPQTETEKKEEK